MEIIELGVGKRGSWKYNRGAFARYTRSKTVTNPGRSSWRIIVDIAVEGCSFTRIVQQLGVTTFASLSVDQIPVVILPFKTTPPRYRI